MFRVENSKVIVFDHFGFIFNQISKLTEKIHGILSQINIGFISKFTKTNNPLTFFFIKCSLELLNM